MPARHRDVKFHIKVPQNGIIVPVPRKFNRKQADWHGQALIECRACGHRMEMVVNAWYQGANQLQLFFKRFFPTRASRGSPTEEGIVLEAADWGHSGCVLDSGEEDEGGGGECYASDDEGWVDEVHDKGVDALGCGVDGEEA